MPTIKRSVFLSLNVFWALIAGLVAVHAPERVSLWLQNWNLKPPAIATETEVQAGLSAAALPPNFMNAIASLHRGDPQKGTDGAMHKPDSITGVPMSDGLQIYNLVRKVKPKKTLEVGFAYGVSTMYFLAALQANGSGSHIAIDPFEVQDWKGIGLMKVKEVKMEDSFEFIPERSHPALAKLADKKLTFGVMFIDGAHLYDIAFADFVLADALCPKQGYILLHDTWMGSVRRIISFIEKNRLDFTPQPSSAANIAIFQKTSDDNRPWDHYKEF